MSAERAPDRGMSRGWRVLAVALLAAVVVAIAGGGYAVGQSGDPGVARAHASGTHAGLAAGEAQGTRDGYSTGVAAGIRDAYRASYGPAYRAAYAREATLLELQASQSVQQPGLPDKPQAPPAPPSPESPIEQQIRECANSQRTQHGLPPLAEDPVLDRAAHFHANNMLHHDFVGHTDPWGRGPAQRVALFDSGNHFAGVGENLGAGEPDVQRTCSDWMNSPGHRENILNPSYKSIGTGFARGNSVYGTYYVQDFGIPN